MNIDEASINQYGGLENFKGRTINLLPTQNTLVYEKFVNLEYFNIN